MDTHSSHSQLRDGGTCWHDALVGEQVWRVRVAQLWVVAVKVPRRFIVKRPKIHVTRRKVARPQRNATCLLTVFHDLSTAPVESKGKSNRHHRRHHQPHTSTHLWQGGCVPVQ